MISMRPILEPDVIALLNDGRFAGEIEGYVVMEGERYHGHALFRVNGDEVDVLDTGIADEPLLDGAVRACLSAGESRGAAHFRVNHEHPPLAKWWDINCQNQPGPVPISALWGTCGHG